MSEEQEQQVVHTVVNCTNYKNPYQTLKWHRNIYTLKTADLKLFLNCPSLKTEINFCIHI